MSDDPQDAVVANQYIKNREEFEKNAKEWTDKYAKGNPYEEKMKTLLEMGFDQ